MALIVVFSSLFSSSLVHYAAAQKNQSVAATVDMKCKCYAVGRKFVNIVWEPLPQDPESSLEPSYYRVFFCTSWSCNSLDQAGQYHLGCTLNTTQQSLKQKELQCRIAGETLFPLSFYFILEMRNVSGVFISRRKTCRLSVLNFQCTKPLNFRVIASGKRNLSVSWEPAPYMGRYQSLFLCYRIWYASRQGQKNETLTIPSDGELSLLHTIFDLNPYTKYTLFIQCGLVQCLSGWGALSGPVTGMTEEEVPAKAPEFENYRSVNNIESDKRDVIVSWKLPPSNTWNGVLNTFAIDYWLVSPRENDSLIPIPNSSRSLVIDNGSANKATLFGLKRFADYQTQISMCTSEGCGPKSVPLVLKGVARDIKINKAQSDISTSSVPWDIIGPLASAVVVIVILILAACKCARERRRRRNLPPLNEILQLDHPPLYDEPDDSHLNTQHSYDQVRHECDTNVFLHGSFQTEQGNSGLVT